MNWNSLGLSKPPMNKVVIFLCNDGTVDVGYFNGICLTHKYEGVISHALYWSYFDIAPAPLPAEYDKWVSVKDSLPYEDELVSTLNGNGVIQLDKWKGVGNVKYWQYVD
jgi:hypothetical protein